MRSRAMSLLVAAALVAACGGGREDRAAQACKAEMANRLAGKDFAIDVGDLARHAKAESADTLLLSSTVTVNKGLSTEKKDAFDCRVRFDAAGTPSVLYLQFNWNTSELKPAE
jgi:hypothetical protein